MNITHRNFISYHIILYHSQFISEKGPNVKKGDQKGTNFSKKSLKETFPLKGDRLVNTGKGENKSKEGMKKKKVHESKKIQKGNE